MSSQSEVAPETYVVVNHSTQTVARDVGHLGDTIVDGTVLPSTPMNPPAVAMVYQTTGFCQLTLHPNRRTVRWRQYSSNLKRYNSPSFTVVLRHVPVPDLREMPASTSVDTHHIHARAATLIYVLLARDSAHCALIGTKRTGRPRCCARPHRLPGASSIFSRMKYQNLVERRFQRGEKSNAGSSPLQRDIVL